jgi:HD-GYP domain-containing protein (c-di-GMP phosphodiesterase class II)
VLGQPLGFGVRDGQGTLLLACGHVIETVEQMQGLLDRGAFIDQTELEDPAAQVHSARPDALPQLWADSVDRLGRALRAKVNPEFRPALERAARPVLALVQRDPDLAILQVVRQDDQPINQYSSRHAVHVAVAGQLAAKRLGWGTDTATSLFRAALTMNLSMSELQDKLATQVTPLTALQRQTILEHPERGAELLETAGVTDPDWLAAVRGHHCFEPGGYPQGLGDTGELAKLLHRADVFAAKFSPRSTRAAQAPDAAVRNFFQAAPGDAMTAAIVKEFGLYPPGATVKLKSGEIGVVMRRGERANTPMVAAVTDCNGDVLLRPERRDTAKPPHAVVATLPAKALKVRVNVEAMIRAMPG